MAYTIGIVVLFVGVHLNRRFNILRSYNIPEPVTGGLLAAIAAFILYQFFDIEISFDMYTRDLLLVYFFTAIGLNARISDLVSGGRPLIILLVLTLGYIVIQDVVGISGAMLLELPLEIGVLTGSAALIGGHGTAIAWAPDIAEQGISNALEIGIASATLGLVIASLIGGPIAKYLIKRYRLKSTETESVVGLPYDTEKTEAVDHLNIMAVILELHIAMIFGWIANEFITEMGFKLPLFVTCLLSAIMLSNIVPLIFPNLRNPTRTTALALVTDFALGLFLSMSLMSMQLWTIAGLAGPLLILLLLQTLAAILFILFVLFKLMGKDYQAAVISAGFGGFALGATPTAIANMTAVTKAHGPAPLAFIMLPLVAAFFVDVANAFVIRFALTL